MKIIKTKSTSRDSLEVSDIILREEKTSKLLFRPLIVNNKKKIDASVKGWFIFQKKGINDEWEDYSNFKLSQLKKMSG
ncbi:MAG: hypothetical protein GY830_01790 [Bacteroidetes bacterium]|nr:hypothetical protein [Bacteroidota bacterium]